MMMRERKRKSYDEDEDRKNGLIDGEIKMASFKKRTQKIT
jgi:hypothetical protein